MKRPLVLVIVSFILGIIFMNIKRTIFYMALLFFAAFLFFNRKYLKEYRTKCLVEKNFLIRKRRIKIITIIMTSFFVGCIYGNINYMKKIQSVNNFSCKEVAINGVVIAKEENEYLLKKVHINGDKIKGKIKIKSSNEYKRLEEFSAKSIIELPMQSMNFGGFDYRQYLFSKNIVGIGEEIEKQEKIGLKLSFIESGSIKIREFISNSIDNSYPDNEAQILKAILIGESSTLEDEIKEFYQKAGIIHVLVVSGAHIALIIVSLKVLLDKLKVSRRWYDFTLIFLIIIYIYISGAGESVVRAGVVSIIALMAKILGRQNDSITTIFLSAFILTVYNPMIIYGVGFQLSFAGALGIILLSNKIKNYLMFLPKVIAEALSVSLSAQLFVLPITAYHFNSINLMGMISSLVVMPIIDLIMPLGFISVLPGIGQIIVNANYFLISLLFTNAKIFSYLNIFEITVVTPKISYVVMYYMVLLIIFVIKVRKRTLVVAILILGVLVNYFNLVKFQDLEMNYLYVGHGDSMFIVTPNNKTILIDTGDNYMYKDNEYNMAEKTVIPFILDKGHKKIDLMILSHMDSDHAGGVETIIEKLDVKQLLVGENSANTTRFFEIEKICKENRIPISLVNEGDKFNIGEVKFNVLAPFGVLRQTENNNSIVLMMEYKDKKTLFMGDMELEGEEILVKKYKLDADILKVGHHGSVTSSTEELIKEVTPKVSIISVGDRFASLPSKDVLDRLKTSEVYITKKDGGIRICIDKRGKINIETANK